MLWCRREFCSQDIGVMALGFTLLTTVLIPPGFILSDARKMHLVYWNTSNPLFRANTPKDLRVSIQDQIAFICPNRVPPTNKVFWTTDVNFYKTCQQPVDHLSLIHLLVDCSQKPPAYHLLIEVSVLINQLPVTKIKQRTRIFFMADTELCKLKNMHMNVTVVIPERSRSIPEGRNIALADSAANAVQEDMMHMPSPKPVLNEFGMSVSPRSSRFIGLLVAYILITLLVVYMVVCAVCIQPRKCLNLSGRESSNRGDAEHIPESSPAGLSNEVPRSHHQPLNLRRWCLRPRSASSNHISRHHNQHHQQRSSTAPPTLPRINPHFSRSVDGKRFLHYPEHFRLTSPMPPGSLEQSSTKENWTLIHQNHHQQRHHYRRSMMVDTTLNQPLTELNPSPLLPLGTKVPHYVQQC